LKEKGQYPLTTKKRRHIMKVLEAMQYFYDYHRMNSKKKYPEEL
jgi:hypothetical protein